MKFEQNLSYIGGVDMYLLQSFSILSILTVHAQTPQTHTIFYDGTI